MLVLAAFSLSAALSAASPVVPAELPAPAPPMAVADASSVMVFNDSRVDVTIEYVGPDSRPASLQVAHDGRAMLSVPRAAGTIRVRAGRSVSNVSGDFRTESVLVIGSSGNVGWEPVSGG